MSPLKNSLAKTMPGYERSPHYGFRSRTRMFRVPDDEGRHDSDSDATVTDTHCWGDENGSNSHPTDDSVNGDSEEAGFFGANEGDKKLAIVRWSSHSVPRTQTSRPSEPNCRVSYFRKFSQAIQRLIAFEEDLWQCMDYWIDLCTDAPIIRRARVEGRKQLSIEIRDLIALVLFGLLGAEHRLDEKQAKECQHNPHEKTDTNHLPKTILVPQPFDHCLQSLLKPVSPRSSHRILGISVAWGAWQSAEDGVEVECLDRVGQAMREVLVKCHVKNNLRLALSITNEEKKGGTTKLPTWLSSCGGGAGARGGAGVGLAPLTAVRRPSTILRTDETQW
ncbi:hypothetical protein QBC37DRAFT_448293 [Rhypophila decipiens]|uniref:Uncharacterized protein n=1 Tax=Rhypophila decipiens TaxID=261697 RepID=A0AAN6Y1R6_9PEZI|nr:hypothetical protein QBC37DRAFT_448293 [Rhypophila decipiens]